MRFKDVKQHRNVNATVEVVKDRFNNITVLVSGNGKELREDNVSEAAVDRVTKKLIKKLR